MYCGSSKRLASIVWEGGRTCAHVGHLLGGEHGEGQLGEGPRQLQAAGDGALLQLLVADAVHVLDGLAQQRQHHLREQGLPEDTYTVSLCTTHTIGKESDPNLLW